jgi:hypothetical protein
VPQAHSSESGWPPCRAPGGRSAPRTPVALKQVRRSHRPDPTRGAEPTADRRPTGLQRLVTPVQQPPSRLRDTLSRPAGLTAFDWTPPRSTSLAVVAPAPCHRDRPKATRRSNNSTLPARCPDEATRLCTPPRFCLHGMQPCSFTAPRLVHPGQAMCLTLVRVNVLLVRERPGVGPANAANRMRGRSDPVSNVAHFLLGVPSQGCDRSPWLDLTVAAFSKGGASCEGATPPSSPESSTWHNSSRHRSAAKKSAEFGCHRPK